MRNPFCVTREFQRHLVTTDTNTRYEWMTPWMLATGVDSIREAIKGYNCTNLTFAMFIQTATTRPDVPNAPSSINGTVWTSGENPNPMVDNTVSSITNGTLGALWFRLGVAYDSTAAGFGQGSSRAGSRSRA